MKSDKIKIAKQLAKGIGGWLQFEHACHRSSVFSEKYLSVPISQILNTHYGSHVYAEVKHPLLSKTTSGRGRPPEIDFVVLDEALQIQVAIESKWVGHYSAKKTVERIYWDLIRLAMLGNTPNVQCYFILAGKKKELIKLFANKYFRGEIDKHGRHRPILKTKATDLVDHRIDSPRKERLAFLAPIFKQCQNIELPIRLSTGTPYCFPQEALQYEYQAYVWEIMPNPQKLSFKPKNHKHYSTQHDDAAPTS